MQRFFFFFLAFFALTSLCEPAPEVRHFFPDQEALLGRPVYWLIKITYPVWESYEVRLNPLTGTEFTVHDKRINRRNQKIEAHYVLKILPNELKVVDTPSVLIVSSTGQTTALNGRPLRFHLISGDSIEKKEAGLPQIKNRGQSFSYWLPVSLAVLTFALLMVRRKQDSEKERLIKQLKRVLRDLQQGRPVSYLPLWNALRSEKIWGAGTQACTSSELQSRKFDDFRVQKMAKNMGRLELLRFSSDAAVTDLKDVEGLVQTALSVLTKKKPKYPIQASKR